MELRPEVQRSLASHTLNTLVIVALTHSASPSPSTPRPLPGTEPRVPQPGLLLPGAQRFEWWLLCCYIKTDPGKSLLLHILSRCPVKKGADVEVMRDGCSAKISEQRRVPVAAIPQRLLASSGAQCRAPATRPCAQPGGLELGSS